MTNSSNEKPQPIKQPSTMKNIGMLLFLLLILFIVIVSIWLNIRAHIAVNKAIANGNF
jgi:hypothetical protein